MISPRYAFEMFTCRWCTETKFTSLWNLGDAPYGDLFQKSFNLSKSEKKQTLELVECKSCKLLQLKDKTDVLVQYDNYIYKTATTLGLNEEYFEISKALANKYLTEKAKIIDIGCNDGTFLKYFKQKGYWVLGVEPAKPAAEYANSIEIKTINNYFSQSLVNSELLDLHDQIDLISANYVIANVEDLKDFLLGIKKLLRQGGYLSLITGYHPDQFAVAMFEYINHDHLMYFTIKDLLNILKSLNFTIIEINKKQQKGGSIHLVAKKGTTLSSQSNLDYLIQRENWLWPDNLQGILQLKNRIDYVKKIVLDEFNKLDSKIIGIGASISTTYLINYFEISSFFNFLVDDDLSKIGKFSPYYGHEVISFKQAKKIDVNKFCILAWQHTNALIKRFSENALKGDIYIPLPNPHWI